jgi:outer membrane receptor protein involved in Fe transport
MRFFLLIISISLFPYLAEAQQALSAQSGTLSGNLMRQGTNEAVSGATIQVSRHEDPNDRRTGQTDDKGDFRFQGLSFGWYSIRVTMVGSAPLQIDSIHIRADRPEMILADLILPMAASGLETIVIFAEKPLIEQKEGNLIFNAAESPLSNGSNASELLRNIPLVSNDPDGRITVRGREPRILVDDKPVAMNAQQMQDFLESMPGGMIERIEVMTNPPAQYANEPGGVINIVTRKGKTGVSGRFSLTYGSRGEAGASASFNLRKKGLSIQFNTGTTNGNYRGEGGSIRENRFKDSTNQLRTDSRFNNRFMRPVARLNIDQDIDPRNTIGITVEGNINDYDDLRIIDYTNVNRFGKEYRRSERSISSAGININPTINLSYLYKGKQKGETLRFIFGAGVSNTDGVKDFRQTFTDGDYNPMGRDSAQEQGEVSYNRNLQLRVSYDRPIIPNKTTLSTAAAFTRNLSDVDLDTWDKEPDGSNRRLIDFMSNEFVFSQDVMSGTLGLRQRLGDRFWLSGGMTVEKTDILFDLIRDKNRVSSGYENWQPYANINKNWDGKTSVSFVYRRTMRRPGIRELNPTIDYSDPYNLRFGNPDLRPSPSHNLDLVFGRTLTKFQMNVGLGYNRVEDIFATVRLLKEDGRTNITWQNISGREEWEANTWMNLNLSKGFRMNANASYTINLYSKYDQEVNRYRNGASINGRVNLIYAPIPEWNVTSTVQINRYANPQGTVRSTVSTIFGGQYRFWSRRLSVTAQVIDPFIQQTYATITEGVNFKTESRNLTRTRNYRLTLSYHFSNTPTSGGKSKNSKRKPEIPVGRNKST